ncbi:YopX family protein [Paenibacillus sp. Dod16]|uniref:YopX family protein n=1 Tax=Paenibacillus sp. Dod16 TaxID=3416392 RepID=UPI003CEDFBAD
MRDYKFRGKRIDNGEWVYGDLMTGKNPSITWWKPVGEQSYEIDCADVDPETVGQVFDFGDKEENELYPGDIIKTVHTRASENASSDDPFSNTATGYEEYEKVGLIEYHRGYTFGPRLRWKKGHMMIPNTSTLWRMKAVKLGNRWDNPDLLEG